MAQEREVSGIEGKKLKNTEIFGFFPNIPDMSLS